MMKTEPALVQMFTFQFNSNTRSERLVRFKTDMKLVQVIERFSKETDPLQHNGEFPRQW